MYPYGKHTGVIFDPNCLIGEDSLTTAKSAPRKTLTRTRSAPSKTLTTAFSAPSKT